MFEEINTEKITSRVNSLKENAEEKFSTAKKSIISDAKEGGFKKVIKNKYLICISIPAIFLFFWAISSGGGGVPSDILKNAVFDAAGQTFVQKASNFTSSLFGSNVMNDLQGLAGGGQIAPETMCEMNSYKITNQYTKTNNEEKLYIYDYEAQIRGKGYKGKPITLTGTVCLVKRGNSWYSI